MRLGLVVWMHVRQAGSGREGGACAGALLHGVRGMASAHW